MIEGVDEEHYPGYTGRAGRCGLEGLGREADHPAVDPHYLASGLLCVVGEPFEKRRLPDATRAMDVEH